MRTTVNIDDELFAQASELTGLTERTALLNEGLRRIVEQESARRLAALGGSDPQAQAASRRRSA